MRILHCIYDDPANPWVGGGGSLRVLEIYRRLSDRLDVTVASGAFPGGRDETIEGVRYRRLGIPRPYPLSRLSYAVAATRLLARGDYDVGVLDFSGYTPVRLPADRCTAAVVHMLHGPTSEARWGRTGSALLRSLERAVLRRAPDVCVTSDWLRRALSGFAAPDARFHLVRSGVPDTFFDVERREAGFLLFYGRFDVYQKGLDVLLDAFDPVADPGGAPARMRMLGRGRDAGELRAMVRQRGLADRIEIVENPERGQVLDAMAGALAMVHPSRFEGLPMVPAEAMAAGVPVIATDVGAVAEVLDGGAAGRLVPAGDAVALTKAMQRLIDDGAERAALSARARESARRFHWDRVAEEHLGFLAAVFERCRGRSRR